MLADNDVVPLAVSRWHVSAGAGHWPEKGFAGGLVLRASLTAPPGRGSHAMNHPRGSQHVL